MRRLLSRILDPRSNAKPLSPRRTSVLQIESLETRLVPATTFKVNTLLDVVSPTDGKLSLREAITAANVVQGNDIIQLTVPGTYKIALVGSDNTNLLGDYDITESVTIQGLGSATTAIESNTAVFSRERLFDVLGTINVAFANLTLQKAGSSDTNGGAVQALTASLKFDNCVLTGNVGQKGAAVNDESGNVTMNNCTLSLNRASSNNFAVVANGGAIFAGTGTVTLTDTRLTGNTAVNGGAIFSQSGNVTMLRCTVDHNFAEENGGGVDVLGGTLSLKDSTVRLNTAGQVSANGAIRGGLGGGVFTKFGTATNCTFNGNSAANQGGAVFASDSITFTGGTVSTNSARNSGGGILGIAAATLTNTTLSGNTAFSATGFGGGVDATAVIMTGSTVRGNVAGNGGGIAGTFVSLTTTTVSGNSARNSGGGIFANSSASLTGCTLSGNTASLGDGGGLFCPGTVTLFSTTVTANSSGTSAGGVAAGTANVTTCTISGNHTRGFGGGLSCVTATVTTSTISDNSAATDGGGLLALRTATVTSSTVSDNLSGTNGGGIKAVTVNLTNVTVSGNSAGVGNAITNDTNSGGGGVCATHGTILNCTIVENFATGAGGGLLELGALDDFIHVKNTIIALNLVPNFIVTRDLLGNFTSEGHNLIGVINGGGGFSAAKGDQFGFFDSPLDPLLAPLANNGGPTKTHALLAGSTAIDRGDNQGAPATDQRGVARPRDGSGKGTRVVDIGAFEK